MKYKDHCDIEKLQKPKFADRWSCDKPIENNKVAKKTKCEIVCPDGYDIKNGEVSVGVPGPVKPKLLQADLFRESIVKGRVRTLS